MNFEKAGWFLHGNAFCRLRCLNDAMPAFRGLISWIECSSRFAAPGDVSRIVSSNQEPARGISQRIRREREMTANKRSALSLRCDDDWKLGVASRSKRERVIRSLWKGQYPAYSFSFIHFLLFIHHWITFFFFYSFIHSFIITNHFHSFIHSSLNHFHSFIYSLIHSFIYSFFHSFVQLFFSFIFIFSFIYHLIRVWKFTVLESQFKYLPSSKY